MTDQNELIQAAARVREAKAAWDANMQLPDAEQRVNEEAIERRLAQAEWALVVAWRPLPQPPSAKEEA